MAAVTMLSLRPGAPCGECGKGAGRTAPGGKQAQSLQVLGWGGCMLAPMTLFLMVNLRG